MAKFLVETISTFKHQYIIDSEKAEYALDDVTLEEAEEFSQHWLGEHIISIQLVDRVENVLEADPLEAAKQIDEVLQQVADLK
jgi:hypothetical protein